MHSYYVARTTSFIVHNSLCMWKKSCSYKTLYIKNLLSSKHILNRTRRFCTQVHMLMIFEMHFKFVVKFWKIMTKNVARTSRCSMCSQNRFIKKDIFYIIGKKDKIWCKKDSSWDIFFIFLHRTREKLIVSETWYVYIECQNVCAKFLFGFS